MKKETVLKKTVRISTIEGVFAQIHCSLAVVGSVFLTKFAVLLNATAIQFSILSAIGQFSQIFQPLGVILTRKYKYRKKSVFWFSGIGRLFSFFFGFIPFLFLPEEGIWIFLALCLISSSLQAIGGNIWISWISDMIPLRIRGRFFSNRNRYLMFAGLVTSYLLSVFIDTFDKHNNIISKYLPMITNLEFFKAENLVYGFLIVFTIGTIIGIMGLFILNRQPEKPKFIEDSDVREILIDPFRDKNFRALLVFGGWWMLAVGIGAPFWGPFMIKNLGMSLLEMQLYATVQSFASIFSLKTWGIIIDRFGNKTAMRIAIIIGGFNPLLWLFASADFYWYLYFEAAISGVMWAGAGIVSTNYVLSIAPRNKSQIYSGIYGAFTGICMVVTMLISGVFLPPALKIGNLEIISEQVLFGLTGLFRWTAIIPLLWIHEPNSKPLRLALSFLNQGLTYKVISFSNWMFRKK